MNVCVSARVYQRVCTRALLRVVSLVSPGGMPCSFSASYQPYAQCHFASFALIYALLSLPPRATLMPFKSPLTY